MLARNWDLARLALSAVSFSFFSRSTWVMSEPEESVPAGAPSSDGSRVVCHSMILSSPARVTTRYW